MLRNYLGTALIHAYELRHLTLKKLLVAQSAAGGSSGMLDLDADLYLTTYSRSVMLEWVDALWSCFLEVCVYSVCVWRMWSRAYCGWRVPAQGTGLKVVCSLSCWVCCARMTGAAGESPPCTAGWRLIIPVRCASAAACCCCTGC